MTTRRIQAATEVLSYKWHPVILYVVNDLDGAGYSELEARLEGISSKVLSDGLSDLCERNLLATTETIEDSGRTVYVLSEKGRAVVPVLDILDAWHQRYEEKQISVLIIENEQMVASMLGKCFSDSYDIQSVQTGEEGLEECTDDTDLVIIDRKLDRMSGDDVAARIRATQETELILCVSGVEPDDDICDLKVDDYIQKPVGEDEMESRLELLLNRAELDATARAYLALRSKQIALADAHGKAATKMDGYKTCTARIDKLDLSSDQKQTLEPLLPSAAN